ncbi:MAG TPA: acylneuraminate cytidylyltransferase family protein [Gaiellaceae bacterium]
MTRRALGVIPARGGSRRIPRKNLALLGGRPLIAWTIEAALRSGVLDRVVVSTDDTEIANVARSLGADVPFLRDELADDMSGVDAVTVSVVRRLAETGDGYDEIVQLLPTSPLRGPEHVRGAVERFRETGSPAQASCFRFGWDNPWWAFELDDSGTHRFAFPGATDARSQDLPPLYGLTGAVWVATAESWRERNGFPIDDCTWYELPWRAAIDVDEPEDLDLADALLEVERRRLERSA